MGKYTMRALISITLFSFFGLCGGGGSTLPTLGKVDPKALCDDPARCEVRGDSVYNALKKGPPPYLARSAGPEQFLGKIAPTRNPLSALKSCGGEVKPADWLSTAPTIRELVPDKDGKQRIRDGMKAQLVTAMGAAGLIDRADADLKANVDSAISAVDFSKVSLVEQTHWLSDASFEKRVAQCGDDFYDQVVYSITVVGLADLFQKDLELKLGAALAARLVKTAPPPDEAAAEVKTLPPGTETLATEPPAAPPAAEPEASAPAAKPITTQECQGVARAAVTELAATSRFVAAFGFDDR